MTKHIGKLHPAWLKTLIGLFMKKKQTKWTAPPVKYAKLANRSNPMYIEWSSRTQKGNLKQPINCCCCFRQVIFWFRQTNNTLHLSKGTN